jgi:hypothetical protein
MDSPLQSSGRNSNRKSGGGTRHHRGNSNSKETAEAQQAFSKMNSVISNNRKMKVIFKVTHAHLLFQLLMIIIDEKEYHTG